FSPIRGPEGNIEYLAYMRKTGAGKHLQDTENAGENTEEAATGSDAAGLDPQIAELIKNTVSEAHNSI
ncbi:MAG: TlyA family RNA methyltransferase, partial [Lachnospiraceae bacterium]|nr:TlyA family RNA methyltransferase [Lachnospiraceae bacterium]